MPSSVVPPTVLVVRSGSRPPVPSAVPPTGPSEVIAAAEQRTTSPIGTSSLVHDHAAFFSSSGFEHPTADPSAPAARTAKRPELMMREEDSLLMPGPTAQRMPSPQGPLAMPPTTPRGHPFFAWRSAALAVGLGADLQAVATPSCRG